MPADVLADPITLSPDEAKAAEKYLPDVVYRLNPLYTMVKRNNRILLLELDPWFKTISKVFHIHPYLAVLLSLFDGTRTFSDAQKDYNWLLEAEENFASKLIADLSNLKLTQPALLPLGSKENLPLHFYEEDGLLVPLDQVDLKPVERLDFPIDIVMMPTNSCQVDCIYCYAEHDRTLDHLLPSRWCELIDEIAMHKVPTIVLGGGDPMVYYGIDDVIKRIIGNNMQPFISTKAVLTKDRCKKLKDLGLSFIQVSLDSGVPHIADKMVDSDGYFDRIIQTIQNLVDAGIKVLVKSVCTSVNIDTLASLVARLDDMGCKNLHMVSYSKTGFRHDESLFLSNEQVSNCLEQVNIWKRTYPNFNILCNLTTYAPISTVEKKRELWEKRPECSTARRAISILANGDIAVCDRSPTSIANFRLGNVAKQSIAQIWQSPRTAVVHVSKQRTIYRDYML